MIFHSHHAIFLHIGKTAGTAIEHLLMPGRRDAMVENRHILFGYDRKLEIYLQHASLKTVQEIVGVDTFKEHFTFSIVRNPFARLISVFNYQYDGYSKEYGSFDNFVRDLPEKTKTTLNLRGSHVIPQVLYTHQNGQQAIDYIGKMERLDLALSEIGKRLNLGTPVRLPPKPKPSASLLPLAANMASYSPGTDLHHAGGLPRGFRYTWLRRRSRSHGLNFSEFDQPFVKAGCRRSATLPRD